MAAPDPLRFIRQSPRQLRDDDELYETHPTFTEELLALESFPGPVREPACGSGYMARALAAGGHRVVSSDLNDHGFGTTGVNFLSEQTRRGCRSLVTNPPNSFAFHFAAHAAWLEFEKFALFVRLQWIDNRDRQAFFKISGLAKIVVLNRRPMFLAGGGVPVKPTGGMISYCWCIWEKGHAGDAVLKFP